MSMKPIRRWIGAFVVVCVLSLASASADVSDLVKRLPSGGNCIAVINVEALLTSKLGVKEQWKSQMADAYATKPMTVPPGAKLVVMSSWLEPASVESMWEASVIQFAKSLSMERIARDENGFSERIGDRLAAWTPKNAYYLRLDTSLLGVVSPADRQFAARWNAAKGGTPSPYLNAALAGMNPGTHYLFALDLQEAVSEKRFRRRVELNEFDCMTNPELDVRKVAEAIASLEGLTLSVSVADDISGNCVISFAKPVSVLSVIAKPLLMEVLAKAHVSISDFDNWKVSVKDNAITASGKLTTDGLRELCSVVNPPCPGDTEEAASESESKSASAPDPATVALASQKYYRAVSKVVDNFAEKARSAASLAKGATYVARDARHIARLPILNVDPELVRWGNGISNGMTDVAAVLGVGGINARSRADNIMDAYATAQPIETSSGQVARSTDDAVTRQNIARQRRAAADEEKARALQQATEVLKNIQASRGQIRAAMTAKYKVEF